MSYYPTVFQVEILQNAPLVIVFHRLVAVESCDELVDVAEKSYVILSKEPVFFSSNEFTITVDRFAENSKSMYNRIKIEEKNDE